MSSERYWCHVCSCVVDPIMEPEIACPDCGDGFVEAMRVRSSDLEVDDALTLWAPILYDVVRASRHAAPDADPSRRRRRRGNGVSMVDLLQSLRDMAFDVEDDEDRHHRPLMALEDEGGGISLGDYLVGSGFEALLQQLTENGPSRQGTPPAMKEAVAALATVPIGARTSCPVCLEEMEVGGEGKEMPCRHVFHEACLLPWLEMHSSCPVCRFLLPAEGSSSVGGGGGGEGGSGGRSTWPWPISSFFSVEDLDGSAHARR